MKDYLQDLIQYTHGLGVVELVKVSGTDEQTAISAIANDKSVIVQGIFKTTSNDFAGVFGMPNLSKLKTILGFDDYDENANITLVRNNDGVATTIHFQTKAGDFVNFYRLMSKAVVEEAVKDFMFKGNGPTWNIEFEPSVSGIMRLKKQAHANHEEEKFVMKTDKNDLKIYFGDPSTHSGNFVFHPGVTGALGRAWQWPVKVFLSIMDLPGTKIVKVSDQGAMEITVDSGLATYRYVLPAHSK
jgi:hypothetical protein